MELKISLFSLYLGVCFAGTVLGQSTTEAPMPPDTGYILTKQPLNGDLTANHIISITQSLEQLQNGSLEFPGFSLTQLFTKITSCDTDYEMQELYYYDDVERSIILMENFDLNMDKTMMNESVFQRAVSPAYVMVAVDWVNHNVYWVDPVLNEIRLKKGGKNNDTSAYYIVIKERLRPQGLAVDPLARFIFWTATGQGKQHISKASLSGNGASVIAVGGMSSPKAITLDVDTQLLYYTDGDYLFQMTYEGTNRQQIKYNYTYNLYDVLLFQNVLITTDLTREFVYYIDPVTEEEIFRLNGTDKDKYYGVCSYEQRRMPDPMPEENCSNYGCEDICVFEPKESQPTCLCREGKTLDTDKKSCKENKVSYLNGLVLNNGTRLCIVPAEMLVDHQDILPHCFYSASENETISWFDINMDTREVYFSIDNYIYSIYIDETSQNRKVITTETANILGMSYDWDDDLLYYILNISTNINDQSIWRVSPTDGVPVPSKSMTGESPRAIAVAPFERKVFWITGELGSDSKLEYTDLNMETDDITTIDTSLDLDHALQLYHDVKSERLYLLEEWLLGKFISVMAYNGTYIQYDLDVETEVEDFAVYKDFIILVSNKNNEMDSTLQTADLSGAPPLNVIDSGKFTDFGKIKGVKVLDKESLQPKDPNPCGTLNGGGGCDHICMPEGSQTKCFCRQGFNLVNDTKCVSSPVQDKFILFSDYTYHTIFQIPLDNPSTVIGLSTPVLENPSGVLYEYDSDIIYTANDRYAEVLALHLNGTLVFQWDDGGFSYPDRFAYDPSSKQVYFTSVSVFADFFLDSIIGAFDVNGQMTIIFLGAHYPRDLALYPSKGYLFYTDHGYAPGVYRMNMDGTNHQTLVSDDGEVEITWPNGISIDYEADLLYWTDGFHDTIKYSDLNGNNVKTLMTAEGAHLFGLKYVSGYLYYTGANQYKIKRVSVSNVSEVTEYGAEHSIGVILDLDVFVAGETDNIPKNPSCSMNNGGCSDFCFPTPSGHSCGCPFSYNLLRDEKTCNNRPQCPMTLETAIVNETDSCLLLEGDVCDFHCIPNFKPKPNIVSITCTPEADPDFNNELLWDIDDPCEEILCPTTIDNGTIDTACNRSVGDECSTIMCNSGYELNRDISKLECLPDGTWKMQNQMCIAKCPVMNSMAHSGFFRSNCTRDIGEKCVFFCEVGYRPAVKFTSVTCLSGSEWDAPIETLCEEIICPDYFDGGFINASCSRKLNVICEYSCDSQLQRHPTIRNLTCIGLGDWNHEGDDERDLDILCTVPPPSESAKQTNTAAIGAGVGVGAFVLIVLLIVVLLMLYRTGRLTGSMSPPVAITSFENPRYAENGMNEASGSQTDRSFAYATLEEDRVETPKAPEHVYDNSMHTEQL